jgi:hypothetical protein
MTHCRRFLRTVLVTITVLGAGATSSGRAGAALLGSITVAPAAGPPGTVVTVRGTDCSPGLVVTAQDYVVVAATGVLPDAIRIPVDASGAWHGTFTVGSGALLGRVPIVATCVTDGLPSLLTTYAPQSFAVTTAEPPATAGPKGGTPPPSSSPSAGVATPPGSSTGSASGSGASPGSGAAPSPAPGAAASESGGATASVAARAEPLLEHQLAQEARRAGLHDLSLDASRPGRGPDLGWLSGVLLATLITAVAALAAWLRWTRVQWTTVDDAADRA